MNKKTLRATINSGLAAGRSLKHAGAKILRRYGIPTPKQALQNCSRSGENRCTIGSPSS